MEVVGFIGAFLLSACGAPAAYQAYKEKSCNGMSWIFLSMWYLGEIFTLFYVLPKNDVLPLVMNYGLNIVFISIIIYYKVRFK